jgi:AcrR family transcriptional regulator
MPKVGTRDECIAAGLWIAETGIEHCTIQAVAARLELTTRAVFHHFPGGADTLRNAVFERAAQTRNPFVMGQLKARRGGVGR